MVKKKWICTYCVSSGSKHASSGFEKRPWKLSHIITSVAFGTTDSKTYIDEIWNAYFLCYICIHISISITCSSDIAISADKHIIDVAKNNILLFGLVNLGSVRNDFE